MANLLLVDDDLDSLTSKSEIFGKNYTVIPFFYQGNTNLPQGSFDWAVLDGLEGGWRKIAELLEERCLKEHIIVYSASEEILRDAEERQYRVFDKFHVNTFDVRKYLQDNS